MTRTRKPQKQGFWAWMDEALYLRVKEWASESKFSASRLIRRLLLLIPFDSPDLEIVVLPIPSEITADPERLAAWLSEASAEIREHYGHS